MRDFGKAMAELQALRRKFEGLLDAARRKVDRQHAVPVPQAPLRELTGFGTNPGNLRMLVHVPQHLPRNAPLVVALHGCSQSADDYDYGSGWSSLADRLGFVVVYPEQQAANNAKNCFSWFLPGDTARGQGEAHSIRQMVEHAVATFGADPRRVFVTGLSAGGAMAAVMLAVYPEVFAGGAIIAGLPYGSARSVEQAFEAMFTEQTRPAAALGDQVRAASNHRGPWPTISVWHGTADPIVKPSNAEDIVRQWTNVHGISATPSYEELIGPHSRRVWTDADGNPLIEAFSISGMAHGVPLATTMGEDSCGSAGAFFLDAGISSTHHIAKFWRLGEGLAETRRPAAPTSEPIRVSSDAGALIAAGTAEGRHDSDEAFAEGDGSGTDRPFDPNVVIAAAFKAAGLPIPELTKPRPGASVSVDPAPIIKAALKAAAALRRS
jgi:feruloyl esterase